jgi:hypothetical protein
MTQEPIANETAMGGRDKCNITMICTSGIFIIGNLIGGNKLTNPRLFTIIDDGKRIQMAPLPGNPAFLRLGMEGFSYPIPPTDKPILELYERVTRPSPPLPVGEPKIGTPIQGYPKPVGGMDEVIKMQ